MIHYTKDIVQKECLHWSQDKKECTLCRSGIFIPMPYHVTAYCQNDFCHCPNFMIANKLIANRRHFARQEYRYPIILKNWDTHIIKSESQPLTIDAQTLDFGIGGMRIFSSQKLPDRGLVSFYLSVDTKSEYVGKGEIRWIRETAEKNCSELGISFIEHNTERSI